MTLRQLLISTLIATILCWLIWFWVVIQMNPVDNGVLGLAIFYLSLFFGLLGVFFLASFGFRKIFSKFALEYRLVGVSFRQSFFFALIVVGFLFLQGLRLLNWWNVILLVLAVTAAEFFLVSVRRQI